MSETPDDPAPTSDPNVVTRAEFARMNDWGKSYVTKLGGEGRLVLTEDSRHVLVAESLARIKATTNAPERASPPAVAPQVRADRDRKEFYDAENARLDLEKRTGKLLEKADAIAVVADAGAALAAKLDAIPARWSVDLVGLGGDERRIKSYLTDQVQLLKADLSSRMARMAELGDREGA